MKTVSLTIDGRKITACEGDNLLWAALDNGIYIPNLCALRDNSEPAAACRLCFVEIEGKGQPITACTEEVREGMVVNTRGEKALRLARSAFELIMASHPVDCAHCAANGSCELQQIARHLNVKLKSKRFKKLVRELPIDYSNPIFIYDPNKCVLCGRCVAVCRQRALSTPANAAWQSKRRSVENRSVNKIAKIVDGMEGNEVGAVGVLGLGASGAGDEVEIVAVD